MFWSVVPLLGRAGTVVRGFQTYDLGLRSTLVAVEVHSANEGEISVVIQKKQQAQVQLRGHLKDGRRISQWLWARSGKNDIRRADRAAKYLAEAGISFPKPVLSLS